MGLSLLQSKSNGQQLEREFDNEGMLGHAEAADGGEEVIPVDLGEGVIGPLEMLHEICAQTGSACSVEQCLPDLSCNAFAPDCDICVAVWVLYHFGVKRG